jgi:hypothetical protein
MRVALNDWLCTGHTILDVTYFDLWQFRTSSSNVDSKWFWRWCLTQNDWVSWFYLLSGILILENNVSETESVSVLGWGVLKKELTSITSSLFLRYLREKVSFSPHCRPETDSLVPFSVVLDSGTIDKFQKPSNSVHLKLIHTTGVHGCCLRSNLRRVVNKISNK